MPRMYPEKTGSAQLKILGLDALQKNLEQYVKEVNKELRAQINTTASQINKTAKTLAPVRSGLLRKSIKVSKRASAQSLYAIVRPMAPHGHLVEWGYHHYRGGNVGGTPFMMPAAQMHLGSWNSGLRAAMKQAEQAVAQRTAA